MKKQSESFLKFHGRTIFMSAVNGQYYVAIKPICEALKVDYIEQYKNLNQDKILSQLLCKHTMVAADGKIREMVCLPEKYVYGWLFSIRSDSPELLAYKRECYDVLYDFFHGPMTERLVSLKVKTDAELEVERLERELEESDVYQNLELAKGKLNASKRQLKRLDDELVEGQLSLFASDMPNGKPEKSLREKLIRRQKIQFPQ